LGIAHSAPVTLMLTACRVFFALGAFCGEAASLAFVCPQWDWVPWEFIGWMLVIWPVSWWLAAECWTRLTWTDV
jgi:hypothetical protein